MIRRSCLYRAREKTLETEGKTKSKVQRKNFTCLWNRKGGQFSGLRNQREKSTEKGMGPDY